MAHFEMDRFLKLVLAIQQIPAPTFSEGKRAAFIHDRFLEEGLSDVEVDAIGNVLARLPGRSSRQFVVVSAHLDTVFSEDVDLKARQENGIIRAPGIGDNALGLAGLIGLVWKLRSYDNNALPSQMDRDNQGLNKVLPAGFPGDVWLVANVREEGLGDLFGMRKVVERFGAQPKAYIIVEGMSLGQVYHRGLGVRRYRIVTRTPGGHSWVDFGKPSAIHELANLVTRLTELPLPQHPRSSINVGVISGGTSVNTIAPEAYLELDLRSEDQGTLEILIEKVEALVKEVNRGDVHVTSEVIGDRPVGELDHQHPLVLKAVQAIKDVGLVPSLNIGSTDANIPLSQGLPAVCVGITTGGGAHTLDEHINIQPIDQGLEQLVKLVASVFEEG
ncbi:MAG: M20/M25/M40 family metallo-hydrolase [Anaerolineales bacterium]|nr:M20/M25/M40 family metallo-hydrolase [Anaerolineales bacterium]